MRNLRYNEALGIGSAYGDEFMPIAHNIKRITILDSSDAFSDVKEIRETPCRYIKPNPNGNMPFESNRFDLVSSLGAMHHIPNVSHVMNECFRCLNKDGIMLLREPIVSMGGWRKPRTGLTKRERGIPLRVLNDIIRNAGFTINHKSLCISPIILNMANKIGIAAYNNSVLTIADTLLSQMFAWNMKYHRTKLYQKFSPLSAYSVLNK